MAKQKIRRKHSRSSHALRTPAARKVKSKAVAPVPLAASPALAHKTLTVVGLGSSVGGLEALEEFFKHTPPDSGMAFVVVTHQHPGHTSLLPELLRKSAAMPVAEASKKPAREAELHLWGAAGRLSGAAQRPPVEATFHAVRAHPVGDGRCDGIARGSPEREAGRQEMN